MGKQAKNRVLILHGWESNSREHWFLQAKQRLEKLGLQVSVPDMPNTLLPKSTEWVNVIEEFHPDENSVLVGHSLGGTAVLRYLEKAEKHIALAILIATPIRELGEGFWPVINFLKPDFIWQRIKRSCEKIVVIDQTQDDAVPLQHGKDLSEYVGGELIVIEGSNHFDTIDFSLLEKYIVMRGR